MGSKNINKKTLRLGGEAYKSTLQVNQLRILSDRLMKYTASNWTLVNKRRGGGEMGRMGDGGWGLRADMLTKGAASFM